MGVAAPVRDQATAAVARLLSLGFAPPDAGWAADLAELADALAAEPALGHLAAEIAAVAEHAPRTQAEADDAAAEHQRLFGGAVACPPYEGSYATDPFAQARQMSDIAGFYRAFGAAPTGPAAERPDHVGCELEFLAYVIVARLDAAAAGDDERAAVCAIAEHDFLRDHLGRWLGPFSREVEKSAERPLYAALGRLGQRFAVEELTRRGLDADPRLARRIRTVVEGDEVECGADPGSFPLPVMNPE
ncbi:MAG: molecular chaperone TorD family protein [Thermoleophilia bacterium]|jgi:TorA maturation chaperone TorD|nr:molecular chaperone TorD family protein [Thermoleophilia bacterium]